jgi:hypothetical protein
MLFAGALRKGSPMRLRPIQDPSTLSTGFTSIIGRIPVTPIPEIGNNQSLQSSSKRDSDYSQKTEVHFSLY